MPAFLIVVPDLVEVVFVELADKARKVAMLKVLRKNRFGEAFILGFIRGFWASRIDLDLYLEHNEATPVIAPSNDLRVRRVLQHPCGLVSIACARAPSKRVQSVLV